VLISETWYDYEGRAALSFLPAAEPSPSLAFRANYNAFNNSTGSTLIFPEIEGTRRIKYHYDNGSILDNTTSVGTGSSKYYSSSNPFNNTLTVNKNYIPSAGGFPYVATEYTHDPTGRVSKQGQTGTTLKIDGTRTTRKFYGQAYPEELIRLFGSNVGEAVHYRKEVTVDPNGQASVQYIDQEGRTIATALAGDSPPNLVVPLAEYTSKQSSGWGSVSYDLSAHNKREGSGKYIGTSFINSTANTSHVFSYNLTGIGSDLDQLGCQSCQFELSIRLLDPDGDWVSLPEVAGDQSTDPLEFAKTFTATECQVEQSFGAVNMSVSLPKVGEYRLIKKLVTKEKTMESLLEIMRSEAEFISQKEAVENSFVADPASCEWCLEDCPEAGEAVTTSIEDLVNQEMNSVLERIRAEILEGLSEGTTLTAQELNQQVLNHEDYCEYELLRQTRDSRIFEYKLALIGTWTEYLAIGELLIDSDPLYNSGGIGAGKMSTLQTRLNTLTMGGFSGTLEQLTDPGNVAYRVNALGQPASNGLHFLYYDLLSKQATIPVEEFARRLDEQRWSMYSSFYLNESRKVKGEIGVFAQCQVWVEQNGQFNETPNDQQIQDYLNDSGLLDQISEDELDQVLNQVINSGKCVATFSGAEQNTMRESLRNYLNSNRQENLFNLILEEDLNDPLLIPLKNVLTSKSCSLSDFAILNPMSCLEFTSILVPSDTVDWDGDQCDTPLLVARQNFQETNLNELESFQLDDLAEELDSRLEAELIAHQSNFANQKQQQTSLSKNFTAASMSLPLPTQAEYDALMALYQATGGQNWHNKTGWSTANPNVVQYVGNWSGIIVNATGNVIHLDLKLNNLQGVVPPNLTDLTNLEWLQLWGNSLSGDLEDWLGVFPKLKVLHLSNNNFTGPIPADLGLNLSLEQIFLYKNQLSGTIPTNLGGLSSLRWLVLYDNQLTGSIPSSIGNLSSLQYLYLYRSGLSGTIPSSFANLSSLKFLGLHTNSFTGEIPSSLGSLSNLETILMHSNQFSGSIPSSLGNLTKLKELSLYRNQLSGSIPSQLGNLNNMWYFYLHENQLEGSIPSTFGNLTNLRLCRFNFNQLSGSIPPELGNLPNIEDLRIDNNKLSGVIPASLCSPPRLGTLHLHQNELVGPISPCLLSKEFSSFSLSMNYYSFQDLTGAALSFNQNSDYSPQKAQEEQEDLTILSGIQSTILLNTAIGQNLANPSQYQWFKNEIAIQESLSGADSLTVSCEPPGFSQIPECYECVGNYYVQVTNPDFPGVAIRSAKKRIGIVPSQQIQVCTKFQLDPEFNPWLAGAVYERPWADIVAQCVAEQAAVVEKVQEAAVAQLERSWIERYYDSGTTECLDGAKETLTMTVTNKEYHHTLYYYDQSGNLAQTVPPTGVKPLSTAQVNQVKTGTVLYPAHELVTGYRYNSKNQLVWQNSPDGGTSRFWYNAIGQLRLSQNARQQTANQYSYTKYDAIGRVIETGEMTTTDPLDSLVSRMKQLNFPQRPGYTCTDITLTGYDRPKTGLSPHLVQDNLRGRVSWTAQLEKGKTDTLLTAYSYDPHGNVKTLVQQIPGLAPKKTEYQYDLVSGNVNYVAYQPGTAEQLIHRYRYDADNRIEQVLTSTDGHVWSTDATYYYYPHGPLARVELGEHKVQGLDYYYTLQGWLKGVNMPRAGDPGADGIGTKRTGKDAMAFALGYYSTDYSPITTGTVLTDTRDLLWTRTSTLNANSGLYNGNISWMNTDLPGSQDPNDMQAMVYKYDQLHRLVQARSLREYTTSFTSRTASSTGAYDANYTYDGKGNLLTLQRRNAAAAIQDNFTYGYYANSNKLRQTASAQGNNYEYDAIGNLTKDVAGGVTNIEWTPSGKVRKVTKSTGSPIEFRYDAAGNRVEKKQGTAITRYIRDASGNVMAVYQADTLSERPIYGSSRLGNLSYASKPGYRTVGHKQYELSNHLGNVLAVVSDRIRMKTDSTWTQVISRTDYYPFGLEMTGRTESATYRYGFNGKEKDPSGQWSNQSHYDYGFRIYNPTIGKFLSVDPLTASYPFYTPYQFAGNKPIWAIDLDGKEPWITNGISYLRNLYFGYQQKLQKATNNYIVSKTNSGDFNHRSISNDVRTVNNNLVKLESAKVFAESFVEVSEFSAETFGAIPGIETFGDVLMMTYHGINGNDEDAYAYASGLLLPGVSGKVLKELKGPLHHIFTNKNFIRGQQWSKKFMPLFEKAGYSLQDAINKIQVPGHYGPHPDEYHDAIYRELLEATEGLDGADYKKAFEMTLEKLKRDVSDKSSKLNQLITK